MPSSLALLLSFCLAQPRQEGARSGFDQAFERGCAALVAGRLDEGIGAFEECVRLRPIAPAAAYNLACCHSRKGAIEAAIDWLGKSIEWGFHTDPVNLELLSSDADLDPLRGQPRFQRLLDDLYEHLEQAWFPTLPPAYIDWSGGHTGAVDGGRFSADGRKIVSLSGNRARIWDSDSGGLLVLLSGIGGTGAAWLKDDREVLAGGWNALCLVDARTGDRLRFFSARGLNRQFALSADERWVLCPGYEGVTALDLRSRRQFDLLGGTTIWGVAFSTDCTRCAVTGADGVVSVFDTSSWKRLALAKGPVAFDVEFSPNGQWLVTAGTDGVVRRLDAGSLELAQSWRAHAAEVNGIAYSPDGAELLTVGVDRMARTWRASDGALLHTLSGHRDEVIHGDWSPDGARIVTSSDDGTMRVWDASTGELMLSFGGRGLITRSVAWDPDGTRLVTFDEGGTRQWDATSGRELTARGGRLSVRLRKGRDGAARELVAHEVAWDEKPQRIEIDGAGVDADAVFLSPNRRTVYSTDEDEHGRLWDAGTGHLVRDLGRLSRDGNLTQYSSRWISACFSPDGELLATAQHVDGQTRLWRTETGEEVVCMPGGGKWSTSVVFDAHGEQLAVTRGDGNADVWNTASGERLHSLGPHPTWPTHVAFRPDGQVLATCGGEVRLWDLRSENCLHVLRPLHTSTISNVAFTPDGKRLAAATTDHRLLLWEAESGRLLGTIVPGDEPLDWLAFAPSCHYHGTSAAIARARLVQGAISYPLSCFAAALESPEQVRESLAGVEVELPRLPAPPSLVIAAPVERTSSVGERMAHVQALATEPLAGLAGIEVVQDGVSLPAELLARALTLERSERLARFDLRLPFPAGENETEITLQAVSTRGIKSRPESFVVRYEPPKHELYVLALGVADYDDDALDLAYPVQDVDGLIARLGAQEGELFHDVHVERRTDGRVTAAEVLRLRDQFLLRAKSGDTIVVFVAGHAVRSDTGEYWFLTPDATPDQPYAGIKRADLESLVTWDKLNASKRVLLLDTCHSGAAFGKDARGERGIAFQQSEVDTLLERSSGLYILAATSDDGFAREQEGNGLFTRALLDGLDGAADSGDFGDKDGTVGIDELMHFARYAVLERSAGRQQPTFPKIEGGENFPLARCAK